MYEFYSNWHNLESTENITHSWATEFTGLKSNNFDISGHATFHIISMHELL